jgi:hypothetical protein
MIRRNVSCIQFISVSSAPSDLKCKLHNFKLTSRLFGIFSVQTTEHCVFLFPSDVIDSSITKVALTIGISFLCDNYIMNEDKNQGPSSF